MPSLSRKSDVKRFYLPSTKKLPEAEQAWVDVETTPLVAGDLVGVDDTESKIEMAASVLTSRIKAWNFTEDDGSPIEVSLENVKLMDIEDFMYLNGKFDAKIEGLTKDQKKS